MFLKSLLSALLFSSVCLAGDYPDGSSRLQAFQLGDALFREASKPWPVDGLGNHRALVDVAQQSPVAQVHLEWRRPDLRQETKGLVIIAPDGSRVLRYRLQNQCAESVELFFEPSVGAGTYEIYYLPHRFRRGSDDARYGKPWNDYLPPTDPVAWPGWREGACIPAQLIAFESRSDFDFFTSMGLIASEAQTEKLRAENPQNPIIFPEDRAFPIKLHRQLPAKWGQAGKVPSSFQGQAARNEYYTWQLGVWAAHAELQSVRVEFSDFQSSDGAVIAEADCTCFNQEGTNYDGQALSFDITVPKGQVQALWCGMQVPAEARAGLYEGTVTLRAQGVEPQQIPVRIEVSEQYLADHGDGEIWRHSRLRWLNSQIGVDDEPVEPYQAMRVEGRAVQASEKSLSIAPNGMLEQVEINGKQLLAHPMSFSVSVGGELLSFDSNQVDIKQEATGRVTWTSSYSKDGLRMHCEAVAEYDGHLDYRISLSSDSERELDMVELTSQYSPYASRYFMGVGHGGGAMPQEWSWDWQGPSDSYWAGNELIGAHLELRGGSYHGPLIADYKPAPPALWSNGGKGRVVVKQTGDGALVSATTGAMKLGAEPLVFEFALDLTPVKPLDTKAHFTQRYFHNMPQYFERAAAEGANIANIHHAKSLNPFINYPFVVRDELIDYIKEHHAKQRKVKLYYTIRELTNHTGEIFALSSLGHEIFQEGPGYGSPWHTEHLIEGYKAAWYVSLPEDEADAALVLSGFSRWINYYLEGLRWMFENYEIDGIYMDDVSFDRRVMKRMRKIRSQYRPDSLIDLHSNTNYSKGAMNQYTDFFPYVDRLWFGEHFQYNKMSPDEWFVSFSGIPMGVMSEMLQGGGNPYLGMVYGATSRHSYGPISPAPIWALQDAFGIADARMVGYWADKPLVTSNNENIKATAYIKDGRVLIALGNFADSTQSCRIKLDWQALGLNPLSMRLVQPAIKDFQPAAELKDGQEITIPAKQGLLIWASH